MVIVNEYVVVFLIRPGRLGNSPMSSFASQTAWHRMEPGRKPRVGEKMAPKIEKMALGPKLEKKGARPEMGKKWPKNGERKKRTLNPCFSPFLRAENGALDPWSLILRFEAPRFSVQRPQTLIFNGFSAIWGKHLGRLLGRFRAEGHFPIELFFGQVFPMSGCRPIFHSIPGPLIPKSTCDWWWQAGKPSEPKAHQSAAPRALFVRFLAAIVPGVKYENLRETSAKFCRIFRQSRAKTFARTSFCVALYKIQRVRSGDRWPFFEHAFSSLLPAMVPLAA